MMFEQQNDIKYCCNNCNKNYAKKSSLEKHKILCDFKSKTKYELQIETEEAADIPNHLQLVKIVQELSLKIIKMEEKMEEMQKWVDKKKKKINVLSWLNSDTNIENNKIIIKFNNWLNYDLIVDQSDFENLMENTLFYTIQKIFEKCIKASIPIKCFTQKQSVFYMYDNDGLWRQMKFEDFVILLKHIQNKIMRELAKWKTENQDKFDENDKISELFNKAIIKLMNMSFTQDNSFSKIRNGLYNYLKTDLKSIIDFDFEF